MNQLETFKLRMRPDLFMLECVKKLEESAQIRVRVIRLSGSAWNDLRGCLPFYKQCPAFDNVLLLNEMFVCSVDEPMPNGPEFVDTNGETFFHDDFVD